MGLCFSFSTCRGNGLVSAAVALPAHARRYERRGGVEVGSGRIGVSEQSTKGLEPVSSAVTSRSVRAAPSVQVGTFDDVEGERLTLDDLTDGVACCEILNQM